MNVYSPGTRIAGRYEVASHPLMGGMGIVYFCNDLQENRPVALKTLRPEYLSDRAARDRFLREGTHWVELGTHPHIVHCYQVFRTDVGEEVYLVLELVAKELGREDASLRSWLTPGVPLPVETALLFALQIVRGMYHAVETIPGFVHRDLKPENLLVGADRLSGEVGVNRLRVTDFGLAVALEAARSNQQVVSRNAYNTQRATLDPLGRTQLTHGIVGTPLYMAPEQWRGDAVSTATDVYALGCILYEMVTGRRAAGGDSLAALQQAHCNGQRRPLPDEMAAEFGEVMARCLALEPGERYESWEAAEAALGTAYQATAGHVAPAPIRGAALSREERVANGWSQSEIGVSYVNLSKATVAIGYLEQARAVGEVEWEPGLVGTALLNLGNAYARLGEIEHGVDYFEQSLTIHRQIDDRRGEAACLGSLGNAYADLGDAQRAIGYYEEGLAVARQIGDWQGEGKSLGNLAAIYLQLGDLRRGIGYCEQHLATAREIGNRREEGVALNNLGRGYQYLGDFRRCISYYQQSLAVQYEIGDRFAEAGALGNIGEAYRLLGDIQHAIEFCEQALAIAREIGDRRGEGSYLSYLGNAYLLLDAERAFAHYEQAGAVFEEVGDVMGLVSIDFNMGLLLAQRGRLIEALPYAERAAHGFAQIGHAQYTQQAQQLLAQIRVLLGRS